MFKNFRISKNIWGAVQPPSPQSLTDEEQRRSVTKTLEKAQRRLEDIRKLQTQRQSYMAVTSGGGSGSSNLAGTSFTNSNSWSISDQAQGANDIVERNRLEGQESLSVNEKLVLKRLLPFLVVSLETIRTGGSIKEILKSFDAASKKSQPALTLSQVELLKSMLEPKLMTELFDDMNEKSDTSVEGDGMFDDGDDVEGEDLMRAEQQSLPF